MNDTPETSAENHEPEDLAERVATAAAEIAETLSLVGEGKRHDLVTVVATALETNGVRVVDLHERMRGTIEFDETALAGQPGTRTGRTREQVLADVAFMRQRTRRKPRP